VFEKLGVFSLCQFQKIVYIDSDILVVKNVDDLFSRPHMSAVIADIGPTKDTGTDLNAGVMVIEPEFELTHDLTAMLSDVFEQEKRWRSAAGRPPSMGVQSVSNTFWDDWITNKELHLDRKYNVIADHLDYCMTQLGYRWRGPNGMRILHFTGQVKPWMRTRTNLIRRLGQLVASRRLWEATALAAYIAVLDSARLRVKFEGMPLLP
jgi:lipopolysaccharide biosynthesis glycosyltransferase